MLGKLNNKNLYKIEIPKIDNIEVTGLNDDDNLKLVNSLNLFKSQSLFILNRLELEKILNSNSLIEKYLVFKNYPSSLKIKVSQTKFLAKIVKNGKIFYLGSNGKLTLSKKNKRELPYIFGEFKEEDFFNLFKIINNTKFNYYEIKNLFFFNSGRFDIETYSGLLIKLPRENIKETFNLVLEILNNDNFDKINILDARQEGQVVING